MSKIMSQVGTPTAASSCKNSTTKSSLNGKSNVSKIASSLSPSSSNKTTGNTKVSGSPELCSLELGNGKRISKITRIPISGSMAQLASESETEVEVTREHIGKKVCISGAQIGILRYFGYTKFQEGIWCGVECSSAVGKNDGSVQGHRYFDCKEKFGIFAPVAKVCPVIGNDILSAQKYSTSTSTLCLTGSIKSEHKPSPPPSTAATSVQSMKEKLVLELQPVDSDPEPPSPTSSSSSMNIPAPATTPVQSGGSEYELFKNGKRLKKDSKRGKYANKPNEQQQQKKRKLDPEQKCWSANAVMQCPTSLLDSIANHPQLQHFKEEIRSSGGVSIPLHSPPRNYEDAFLEKLPTSTPTRKLLQRLQESLNGSYTETIDDAFINESRETILDTHGNLSLVTEETNEGVEATSPLKEEEFPFVVPVAPKRPNSIGIPPGLSSEESSELGIFGVSTPELIGGDGASLALSFPASCCSSPEALDNESSLGLLTPSLLQEWNSNTNEEDLYQHLRSPSVDDLEEFAEETTADQDLSSATYSYGSHGGSYMSTTVVCHTLSNGIIKVPEEDSSSGFPSREQNILGEKETEVETMSLPRAHPPLSLRGSGSGYCGSDPLTDSDFNTESEADHDEKGCILMPQNRNARVIDGNLYTSHHLMQSTVDVELDGDSRKTMPIDVVSQSASASEMESSGFYSDASERNPSGGSTESTTSGETLHRRHRTNYTKVTHNEMHPHRQQHYSSSSQHSDPEPNEPLTHYNHRLRHPIPLDADHELDQLIIRHEDLDMIPDLSKKENKHGQMIHTLEKYNSNLDELADDKSSDHERTIIGMDGDSCQSSSSSSSQVLRVVPNVTSPLANKNSLESELSLQITPTGEKITNVLTKPPGKQSESSETADLNHAILMDDTEKANNNSIIEAVEDFTIDNECKRNAHAQSSAQKEIPGVDINNCVEKDGNSESNGNIRMKIPTTLQITENGIGKTGVNEVGDRHHSPSVFTIESSMTTMNTPSSPISKASILSGINSGLASASVRSRSVNCIHTLTSPTPSSASILPNKLTVGAKGKGGVGAMENAKDRNNCTSSTLTRRNLPAKDTAGLAVSKSVGAKTVASRLASAVSNKSTEPVSTSARTESRRITRNAVASKTDTGISKGKLTSGASGASTKENINTSGLASTNRSIVGSNRSLSGLGTERAGNNITATVAAAAKKLNKWDAVMSKIAETKNKQINVKDIKSKVYNSVTKIGTNIVAAHHAKTTKLGKAAGENHEHHPLTPLNNHHNNHNHFSSRSSTASDSSLDEHRAPPPAKHRVKKDAAINRRQISDLSSASDYSASQQIQNQRDQHSHPTQRRNGRGSGTGQTGGNSRATDKISSTNQAQESKKKHSSVISSNSGNIGKSPGSVGSATGGSNMPSRNAPSTKSHTSVKPLRDRNRVLNSSSKPSTNTLNGNDNEPSPNIYPATEKKLENPSDSDNNNLIIANNILNSNSSPINNQNTSVSPAVLQQNSLLKDQLAQSKEFIQKLQEQLSVAIKDKQQLVNDLKWNDTKADALCVIVQLFDVKLTDSVKKRQDEIATSTRCIQELESKKDELTCASEQYKKDQLSWTERISSLESKHTAEIQSLTESCNEDKNKLKLEYESKLASMKTENGQELEILKSSYRTEIEEIETRHREKLEEYRKKSANDILLEEVRSLQVVVDMRNEEIRKLKEEVIHQKEIQDDLIITKEQNKALAAKVEDLEAQIDKARSDKSELKAQYCEVEHNFSQLKLENNRLAHCNEELWWRIRTLQKDERVSQIMTKSATELGLTSSADSDYQSTVSSLLDSTRIRTTGGGVAYEAILNEQEWSSTPTSNMMASKSRKKSCGVPFLAERNCSGARKLNKSLDETEMRNSLNGAELRVAVSVIPSKTNSCIKSNNVMTNSMPQESPIACSKKNATAAESSSFPKNCKQ